MAVTVGSSRIDERGKAKGGRSGDQTGKETSTQNWYLHKSGWVTLRAKDPVVAAKIAQAMKSACANKFIGYDQSQRNTLYNAAKPYGFDPAKVTKAVETDCSALVRVCCAFAGVMIPDFTTPTQAAKMMATGAFEKLTDAKYTTKSAYLKTGDVLVTKKQGHTVVVLSDGSSVDGAESTVIVGGAGKVTIKAAKANIREEPSKTAKLLGVAKKGLSFPYGGETVNADGGLWHKVLQSSKEGWVWGNSSKLTGTAQVVREDETGEPDDEPTEKPIVCADLSQHNALKNPKNDWEKVVESVNFLILRCGVTRTEIEPLGIGIDEQFRYAAQKCIDHGIPFGVYYYGKSKTTAETSKEADKCWEVASPFNPLFYAYDVEEGILTDDGILAFADQLRKRGAKKVGMYIGHNWYPHHKATVSEFDFIWIPRYGKNDGSYDPAYKPAYPCDLHQFTSVGKLPGIVDATLDINRLTGTKPLSWFLERV